MFPFLLIYTSVRHRSREAPLRPPVRRLPPFFAHSRAFFRIFGAPSALFQSIFGAFFALFGASLALFGASLALFGRFSRFLCPSPLFCHTVSSFFQFFCWGEDKVAAGGAGREGAERTRSPKRRGTQLSMREGRVKSEKAMVGRGFAPAAVARQMVGRGCSRRPCAANGRAGGLSAFARSALHLIATAHGRGHFTHPSRSAGSWGCASCGGRRSG